MACIAAIHWMDYGCLASGLTLSYASLKSY